MPKGEELQAILFLEGLQIPFSGATIRTSVDTFCSATIDVLPTDTIRSILPRTLVHIFWKDPLDRVFKLIFEGEIWGKAFTRSANSRGMQLIAFSYDFHWSLSKRYYLDPIQSGSLGTAQTIRIMNEEGVALGDDFVADSGTESAVGSNITDTDPSIPYLTKCINSTLLSLGKRFKLYDIVDKRLKITNRIVSATSSEVKKVFEAETVKKFIHNVSTGGADVSSVQESLLKLISIIHHNYVSLSAPSYDPINKKIKSFIFKPDCYIMPPPRCNVFFPDNYNAFNYTHRFDAEPTRMRYSMPAEVMRTGADLTSLAKNFYMPDALADNLVEMSKKSNNADASIYQKRDSYYNYLTFEEQFRGIINGSPPSPPYMTQLLRGNDQLEKYAGNIANYAYFQQKYMARSVNISGEIDPWLAPGFSCLIIDDSDAKQNIIAHLKSVELRINATEGGYTAVAFDTAREVESFTWTQNMYFDKDMKKVVSDKMDEPQIPRWFDESWGIETNVKLSELKTSINTGKIDSRNIDVTVNQFDKINEKFSILLDTEGGQSITSWRNKSGTKNTILESTYRVLNDYKMAKSRGNVQDWTNKFKARRLPTITETFNFIGAATQQKVDGMMVGGVRYSGKEFDKQGGNLTTPSEIKKFNIATREGLDEMDKTIGWFDGYHGSGDGKTSDLTTDIDERKHIELRRSVIDAYRTELTKNKGFIG